VEINNLLLILATWRLTSLLSNVNEAGPYGVLNKLRYWLGVRWDEKSEPYGKTEIAKGLLCFWCCSVWVGGALAFTVALLGGVAAWWLVPVAGLAYSGGAIILENMLE